MKNIRNLKKAGAVICTICMLLSMTSTAFAGKNGNQGGTVYSPSLNLGDVQNRPGENGGYQDGQQTGGTSKHDRSVKGSASGERKKGEKITLTANLDGFDDVDYAISWQYRKGDGEWQTVKGANGTEYSFTLNEETDGREWRVVVTAESDDE